MVPQMLSPEDLLSLPSDGYFALALDHTGINEAELPSDLRAHVAHWRNGPLGIHVGEEPLDVVADVSHGVVINGFLNAVQHGASGCVAQLIDGQEVFLTFWDRLAESGVVVVVGSSLDRTGTAPVPAHRDNVAARPLRCVIQISRFGVISHIDNATTQILGWHHSVLGSSALTYLHPEDASSTGHATWARLLQHPGEHYGMRCRFRTATGTYRWFDVRAINQIDLDGYVEMEMIDIDDHMQDRPPPLIPVAVGDRLADRINDGTIVVDDSLCVLAFNEAFCELTGAVVSPVSRRLMIGGSAVSKEFATLIASHLRRLQRQPGTAIEDWVGEIKVESELVSVHEDRRYLGHLQTAGVVDFSLDYGSTGRPRRRFRLVEAER